MANRSKGTTEVLDPTSKKGRKQNKAKKGRASRKAKGKKK